MFAFPLARLEAAARVLPDRAAWEWFLKGLPTPVRRALYHEWLWQAHRGQEEPGGDWRVWLLMAGRGFGKTRTGAGGSRLGRGRRRRPGSLWSAGASTRSPR